MLKTADPLAFLLALNLTLAAREGAANPVTPPGLPLHESEVGELMTYGCVRLNEPNVRPADFPL
jgi:hypothetical protein